MKKHEFIKDIDKNGNVSISVSDKPKRRLDLLPRLICVLVAFVIWIWMVNLNDTDLTEKLTFDIELVGVMLNDDNMMIVENGENDIIIYGMSKNKLSVTVQGSNRDIRRFEDENGKIKIDVANLDLSKSDEKGGFTVPFEFELPEGSGLKLIDSEPLEVSFFADYFVPNEVPLIVSSSEKPNNTSIRYEFTPEIEGPNDNERITLYGPQRIISQINYVKVPYDVNFVNSADELELTDLTTVFTGNDGKEIDTMGAVTCSTEGISVLVKAIGTKTLNIRIDCDNEDVSPVPSSNSIEVSGPPSAINQVSGEDYEIKIEGSEAKVGASILHTPQFDDINNLTVKPATPIIITFVPNTEK